MSRYYAWLLAIALLPLCAGCSSKGSLTCEVPREKIQEKINTKFPQTVGGDKESAPVQATLSDPVILLEEGKDKIGVRFNLVAEPVVIKTGVGPPLPPIEKTRFTGTITLFGSVSYDPAKKAIHISDPKVTELKIAQLPDEFTEPLKRLAEQNAAKKFAEEPIPLENTTASDKAVTTFLKSVTVKDGKLLIEIGW